MASSDSRLADTNDSMDHDRSYLVASPFSLPLSDITLDHDLYLHSIHLLTTGRDALLPLDAQRRFT